MGDLQNSLADLGAGNDYDKRKASVGGDANVAVSVRSGVAAQSFSLEVSQLATKEVVQSGTFSSKTDPIANGSGSLKINIGDKEYSVDYDEDMSLEDLARAINKEAKESLSATVVQISDGEFALFLSSKNEGANNQITMSDEGGNLADASAFTNLTRVQEGQSAIFKYNGVDIQRDSNKVDDLIDGLTLTLNKTGTSEVNIATDNGAILKGMQDFTDKFNAALSKLNVLTKASQDADERGIFSNESVIKDLRRDLQELVESAGGGKLGDYGFTMDDKGKLEFNKDIFQAKLDENPANVEAFLSGGKFNNGDGTTTDTRGAFNEMLDKVDSYLGTGKILDEYKKSTDDNLEMFEDRKKSATQRLDARYDILKRQYAAYDSMIAKMQNVSSMFSQMTAAQYA